MIAIKDVGVGKYQLRMSSCNDVQDIQAVLPCIEKDGRLYYESPFDPVEIVWDQASVDNVLVNLGTGKAVVL